jgi:hypothetical protein
LKTPEQPTRRPRLPVTSDQYRDLFKLLVPVALTTAITMSWGTALAAGGDGVSISGVPGGAGGQDGAVADAAGQSGGFVATSSFGRGGGVDLTTGNGAHGGSRGIGGTGTGAGELAAMYSARIWMTAPPCVSARRSATANRD